MAEYESDEGKWDYTEGNKPESQTTDYDPEELERARIRMKAEKKRIEDPEIGAFDWEIDKAGEPWQKGQERDIGMTNRDMNDQALEIMAQEEFGKSVSQLTDKEYKWIEDLMNDYGNTMNPKDKPTGESFATEIEHKKCPHCNFETSYKPDDLWQETDADKELDDHLKNKHGVNESTESVTSWWGSASPKNLEFRSKALSKVGASNSLQDKEYSELSEDIQDNLFGLYSNGYTDEATEERINPETYHYDYKDYWNKGDAYVRAGLAMGAGLSTDASNKEWDELTREEQTKILDSGYVTSYESTAEEDGQWVDFDDNHRVRQPTISDIPDIAKSMFQGYSQKLKKKFGDEDSTVSVSGPPAGTQPPANIWDDLNKAEESFANEDNPNHEPAGSSTGGQFTTGDGGGSSGGSKDKPKEEKRFTLKQYERNEDVNNHGKNAQLLVKQYGTPSELEEINAILKRNPNGYSGVDGHADYQRRYEISQKYYDKLVEDETGEKPFWAKDEPKKKPEENKKREFTLKQYRRNEDVNEHGKNALNLVKQYGTPEEVKEMEGILKRNKDGYSGVDGRADYEKRYEISSKYYSNLVADSKKPKKDEPKQEKPKEDRKLIKSRNGNWYIDSPMKPEHRQNLINDVKERINRLKDEKDKETAKKKIDRVEDMSDEELSKYSMWMGGRDVFAHGESKANEGEDWSSMSIDELKKRRDQIEAYVEMSDATNTWESGRKHIAEIDNEIRKRGEEVYEKVEEVKVPHHNIDLTKYAWESMYGYGSATGRMSPVEDWNQGAGGMVYGEDRPSSMFSDFRGLSWNELPKDIQDAWKAQRGYAPYDNESHVKTDVKDWLNKTFPTEYEEPQKGLDSETKADEDWYDMDNSDYKPEVSKYKIVTSLGNDWGFQTNSESEARRTVDEWNNDYENLVHGVLPYTLKVVDNYGNESVDNPKDINLLSDLLDNELEEQKKGEDEEEDVALLLQLLAPDEKANEFLPELQGKQVEVTGGKFAGQKGEVVSVAIFSDDIQVEINGKRENIENGNYKVIGESYSVEVDPDCEECGGEGVVYEQSRWSEDGVRAVPCPVCGGQDDFHDTYGESYAREDEEEGWGSNWGSPEETSRDLLESTGFTCDTCGKHFEYPEERKAFYDHLDDTGHMIGKESHKKKVNELDSIYKQFTDPLDAQTGKGIMDSTRGYGTPEADGQDISQEEIIEKKPPKINYQYYKQYPFGRVPKGFFGEVDKSWWENASYEEKAKELRDIGFGMGADIGDKENPLAKRSWDDLPNEARQQWGYFGNEVELSTMYQAKDWWNKKYPDRQWKDMYIDGRQRAIMAFLRDPDTELKYSEEGGIGSGRKPYASKDPSRKDKAHVGWKNQGIQNYLDKAEQDYDAGKTSTPDEYEYAGYHSSQEQEGGAPAPAPAPANGEAPPVENSEDDMDDDEDDDHKRRGGIPFGYFNTRNCPEGQVYRDGKCKDKSQESDNCPEGQIWSVYDHKCERDDLEPLLEPLTNYPRAEEDLDDLTNEEQIAQAGHRSTQSDYFKSNESDDDKCENCGREDSLNDEGLCEDCEREAGIDREESKRDAYEGGKGSGKKGHKQWMRSLEEDPSYGECVNCKVITEKVNNKCQMCGKKY